MNIIKAHFSILWDSFGQHIRAQPGGPAVGINGKQAYEQTFNTANMAAGSYLYSVEAAKGSQSGRVLKKFSVLK